MGKFILDSRENALKLCVEAIDKRKFDIPITEELIKANGWEMTKYNYDDGGSLSGWSPTLDMVYDEEICDWKYPSEDFEECFIWYRCAKEAWCYKFNFGTYVYDIKSVGELELILAREGFLYTFDV